MRLLLIMLLFLPVLGYCQSQIQENYNESMRQMKRSNSLQADEVVMVAWKLEGKTCYGCPAFYWSVTRHYNHTGYIYKVWVSTASLYSNGKIAPTYLRRPKLYNGLKLIKELDLVFFVNPKEIPEFRINSDNPNLKFNLLWEEMKIP